MSDVAANLYVSAGPRGRGKASSGRRGRRLGVEIKPGSVKQARLDAGLSLGQVAQGDVSRTAIYYVETGRAKPSIETLQLIAERTGRPLDYFLVDTGAADTDWSSASTAIERLIATGDLKGAIAQGERLLARDGASGGAARIRFLLAKAYLMSGQPVPARRVASVARAYYELKGDLLMAAECLGSEASAAFVMQDPAAVAIAEGALAACRSLKSVPRTTEARLLAILGMARATEHDWQGAIDCYEEAIAAGDVVHDLHRLSVIYTSLSQAYQETDELNQAAHYAHRALAINEMLDDRLSLARTENNLGLLLLKRGDVAEAENHVTRALRILDEAGVKTARANFLMSLCEIRFARADFAEAHRFARGALAAAAEVEEVANVGEAHVWLGRIAAARRDAATTDLEFGLAFETLTEHGAGERLTRAYVLYAELLEARGDLAGANRHLKAALAVSRPAAARAAGARTATA